MATSMSSRHCWGSTPPQQTWPGQCEEAVHDSENPLSGFLAQRGDTGNSNVFFGGAMIFVDFSGLQRLGKRSPDLFLYGS